MENKQRIYVGTYTEPILFGTGEVLKGAGKGIYLLELDREEKKLSVISKKTGIRNPSYLTLSPDNQYLFAVNELKEYDGKPGGSVSSFRINKQDGGLHLIDVKPTRGQDPCHAAVIKKGKFLIVSNFMSGSICAYKIHENGKLQETDFSQHVGSGFYPERQKGPHAHSCIEATSSGRLLIPDLGIDQLMVYQISEAGVLGLCEDENYTCQPGSGPRYGEFHPTMDILYLIQELASSVSVLRYDRNRYRFESIQTISTLPEVCHNICADLHVTTDGKFLYASNRGHDSITAYRVDQKDGSLNMIFNYPCGGRTPRNFALDESERYLMVGNQDTDEIVLFEVDSETGYLKECCRVSVPTPVCLCPL